jgi:START domain
MKHFLSLLILLNLFLPGKAQNGWTLKKEKDGIKVYSRASDHSNFNELKVELTLPASLHALAALILDIGSYPRWSFNTERSYVLKQVSPAELYFYTEINSPWPASNRDLAVHLRIMQDAASKVMTIQADGVPDYIPPKKDIVRVPFSKEKWTVTPLDKSTIRIEYEVEIDPGASAPAWLVNSFSTKGPYETFKNLSEKIKGAKYHDAKVSFIRD